MDFTFTDEQRMFRETVYRFAKEEIAPLCEEADLKGEFNMEIFRGPCLSRRLKGCGAGTEYMAVTPKGELYPCHQLVNYEDFLLGDIYNGIKRHDIRKTFHKTTIFEKENCPDCWARFFCSGGCYGNAYSMNKDIRIPDETGCALQKKRIECALAIQAMIKRDNIKWRGAFL